MMNKEFKLKGYDVLFRIKKMNAIEILAMRSQIDFDSVDKAINTINLALENVEVKCDESWLPVKDRDSFLPVGIENDVKAIDEIFSVFFNELKAVFQQSKTSK